MHQRTPGSGGGSPHAPTQEEWEALSDEARKRVVASLPGREDDRQRFYAGSALLKYEEFISRLEHRVEGLQQQADEAARRADEEAQRADEESLRRQKAEQRVAELQAELDRLKGQ
ncbi:MAG TPA: hypothetical protein VK539_37970 [Myxococcaceae bacterium]|nr:hypothetical protein [Myxococcaceae bacterium]